MQNRSGGATRARRVVTPAVELPGPLASSSVRGGLIAAVLAGQVLLVALVLVPLGPVLWTGRGAAGAVMALVGLVVAGLGLLALGRDVRFSPVPARGSRLHRTGIYAFVRHPMYTGLALAALGVTVATGRLLAVLASLLLLALLTVKAHLEDLILQRKYGWEFAVYAMRVPAIVPQPWRSHRR